MPSADTLLEGTPPHNVPPPPRRRRRPTAPPPQPPHPPPPPRSGSGLMWHAIPAAAPTDEVLAALAALAALKRVTFVVQTQVGAARGLVLLRGRAWLLRAGCEPQVPAPPGAASTRLQHGPCCGRKEAASAKAAHP